MIYVCGFLFNFAAVQPQIALIQKQKPEWQKGKLNGIGGKVEEGETPLHAMWREFAEETSVSIGENRWRLFRTERFPATGNVVHFFSATATPFEWESLRTTENEEVVRWSGDINSAELMYNLRYLIPMAETLMAQPVANIPEP